MDKVYSAPKLMEMTETEGWSILVDEVDTICKQIMYDLSNTTDPNKTLKYLGKFEGMKDALNIVTNTIKSQLEVK